MHQCVTWVFFFNIQGCAAGYIIIGIFGVEFWHFYAFPGWTVTFVLKWVLIGGFFGSIPNTLWNIYEHYTTPRYVYSFHSTLLGAFQIADPLPNQP